MHPLLPVAFCCHHQPRLLPGVQVVAEGSAISGMRGHVAVAEDHISICKPPSTSSNTYRYLKQYIQDALNGLQVRREEGWVWGWGWTGLG